MNRIRTFIAAVLFLIGLSGLSASAGDTLWAKVQRFQDNGTIRILTQDGKIETVRLVGIDFLFSNSDLKGIEGKDVQLTFDKERHNSEKELLAYVWDGNILINEKLIKDGQAYFTDNLYDDVKIKEEYSDKLNKAQKFAIENNCGFWSLFIEELDVPRGYTKQDKSVNIEIPSKISLPTYTLSSSPSGFSQSSTQEQVIVTDVVDGDTIKVKLSDGKIETVRLIGIDTPETVHPNKPVQYFGKEASDYTKRNLEGRVITLTYDQVTRDKYGRLLAYVWKDGDLFNNQIIQEGYAYAYLKYPFNSEYMKRFRESQRYSMLKGFGLWGNYKINSTGFQVQQPVYSPQVQYGNPYRQPTYNSTYSSTSSSNTSGSYNSGRVHVKGYYRKDGTYVRPHTRSRPRR